MSRKTLRHYAIFLVYGLALVLTFLACSGCSMLGSVAGGGVAGAAIAGPPGAAAGAAGGAIGFGWTEIVHWWHNLWDGLFGAAPSKQQVQTVTSTVTVVKWCLIVGAAWMIIKAALGPRYRTLIFGFIGSAFGSVKALVTLKGGEAVAKAREAGAKAIMATGMRHSK